MSPLRTLKERTADLHAEAERHVRILDADADEATYRRFLARMYGFHARIERAFADHAGLAAAGFDPVARTKRRWLVADLGALAVDASTLPTCSELPVLADLPRALGAAYVVEGSTLGGRFILSRMRAQLGHLSGTATRFLEGYRDETGPMWRRFDELATRALVDDVDVHAAVEGAREVFSALIDWLDEPAAPPQQPFWRESRA